MKGFALFIENDEIFSDLEKLREGASGKFLALVDAVIEKIRGGKSPDFQLVDLYSKVWELLRPLRQDANDKVNKSTNFQLLHNMLLKYCGLKPFLPRSYGDGPNKIDIENGNGTRFRLVRPGLINANGEPRLRAIITMD